tara:strand:- start:6336 stop:6734 length:399 start_codon:yes stop_codon:yes gene_type:complete
MHYPLVKIGSLVRINPDDSLDRLSKKSIAKINQSKSFTVIDYKITDGRGIGLIVKLSDGSQQWFFENEIEELYKKNNSNPKKESKRILVKGEIPHKSLINKNIVFKNNSDIKSIINPINFISWLIYSSKDII